MTSQDSASTMEAERTVSGSGGEAPSPKAVAKPEPSTVTILAAGIGGLLAFFGLSFGLVAAVAEPGFLIVCLVTCGIALSLFAVAYVGRRRQMREWEWKESKALASAKCSYCGLQNRIGAMRCESCGAPLGRDAVS